MGWPMPSLSRSAASLDEVCIRGAIERSVRKRAAAVVGHPGGERGRTHSDVHGNLAAGHQPLDPSIVPVVSNQDTTI